MLISSKYFINIIFLNFCCRILLVLAIFPDFYLFLLSFLLRWFFTYAQFPPLYQNQCPVGWEQDGSCNGIVKRFCADQREVCLNGLCCQPSKNTVPINPAMPCPVYTTPNGGRFENQKTDKITMLYKSQACPKLNFCWNPSETCVSGVCCQPIQNIDKIAGQQGGTIGMGGFGGMNGMGGINGFGGMNGIGGMNGMGGMNGFGGMNGIGGMNGMGGMNGFGGIGIPLGCSDFDPSCRYFVVFCFFESIAEVCMMSCGLCSMSTGGLGSGIIGNYGAFGNFGKKRK